MVSIAAVVSKVGILSSRCRLFETCRTKPLGLLLVKAIEHRVRYRRLFSAMRSPTCRDINEQSRLARIFHSPVSSNNRKKYATGRVFQERTAKSKKRSKWKKLLTSSSIDGTMEGAPGFSQKWREFESPRGSKPPSPSPPPALALFAKFTQGFSSSFVKRYKKSREEGDRDSFVQFVSCGNARIIRFFDV